MTPIRNVVLASRFAWAMGAAIINPLKYWLLTDPATVMSRPLQPHELICTGGHPSGESRLDASVDDSLRWLRPKSPIGRSCIRSTPCSRKLPPAAERAAAKNRTLVPLLAMNSSMGSC